MAIHLHGTLNKFGWGHDKRDYQSRKCPVFQSIPIAQLSFSSDCFVEFIRAEAYRADHRCGHERVVDATKQMHESFILDDFFDGAEHAQMRVDLHVDLYRVEGKARKAARYAREAAAEEVLEEVFHQYADQM